MVGEATFSPEIKSIYLSPNLTLVSLKQKSLYLVTYQASRRSESTTFLFAGTRRSLKRYTC